jgi:simple sugar transport system permease protein
MMNYIAIHLTLILVKGTLGADPAIVKTAALPENSQIPLIAGSGALILSYGLVIAILAAIGVWFFLQKTTGGFMIRACGKSHEATSAAGFNVKKIIVSTMLIAGALAGLGGAVEITGLHHTFYGQFSPGYGFDGIAVALLASNHPIGVIFSAILFGALRAADRTLQINAGVPHQLVQIIQGLVILFMGVRYYVLNKQSKSSN